MKEERRKGKGGLLPRVEYRLSIGKYKVRDGVGKYFCSQHSKNWFRQTS